MSREIKFKLKIKGQPDEVVKTLDEIINSVFMHEVERKRQFTGLHDVNGVEIWEKDIASAPGIGKCEVKLCPHYGVVYIAHGDGMAYEVPHADCASEGDYPTILGNIYEHTHLLDEAK